MMRTFGTFLCVAVPLALLTACNAGFVPLEVGAQQLEARYQAKIAQDGDGIILRSHTGEWDAGLRINPPAGAKWFDLSQGQYLAADVENLSEVSQLRLTMHVASGSREEKNFKEVNTGLALNPGEKRTMKLFIPHKNIYEVSKNAHGPRIVDSEHINSIEFKMQWPFEPQKPDLTYCRISNVRMCGKPDTAWKLPEEQYLPFIDQYGQFKHGDWKEKIHSDADLKKQHELELAQLKPAPAEWDQYGGWKNGPEFKGTGSFRTQKVDGKWYLVTPDGNLFFSTGICVLRNQTDATPGRNHPDWFESKVPEDGMMPFTHWNLQKKYGDNHYLGEYYRILNLRLNSWGINTIGNWASGEFMMLGKRPYVLSLGDFVPGFPRFSGSKTKFYDVFDPEFETKMGNILSDKAATDPAVRKSVKDPMCIGYFIDNELEFKNITSGIMKSNPKQPAKQAFFRDLQKKYSSLDALNRSWKTDFKTWDDVLRNKKEPSGSGYRKDANDFFAKFVERYFRICSEGIKKVAPHRLYLGCRFVGFRQSADTWKSASKYCDVVTVNSYTNTINNASETDSCGKPMMIGEFHFGIYDRGMFSPSLCNAGVTQKDRATAYTRFMQGALTHPNIVGCHWFQFRDQPLTGRWDGEGYQLGFVDVCDTPYTELTEAARSVGSNMYQYRMNGVLKNSMK